MSSQAESGDRSQTGGGTSEVSAKEQLNTHGSGEPSADNVDVSSSISGHGNDSSEPNPEQADNTRKGTSEVSAKEQLNTHGSGEPSADNVDVSSGTGG